MRAKNPKQLLKLLVELKETNQSFSIDTSYGFLARHSSKNPWESYPQVFFKSQKAQSIFSSWGESIKFFASLEETTLVDLLTVANPFVSKRTEGYNVRLVKEAIEEKICSRHLTLGEDLWYRYEYNTSDFCVFSSLGFNIKLEELLPKAQSAEAFILRRFIHPLLLADANSPMFEDINKALRTVSNLNDVETELFNGLILDQHSKWQYQPGMINAAVTQTVEAAKALA